MNDQPPDESHGNPGDSDDGDAFEHERPPRLRELLEVASSPDPRHDYLVEYQGQVGGSTVVGIRFVPDRLVLVPVSLATYFTMRGNHTGAEALALMVLDDLNNELVPRWIEVTVTRKHPLLHRVVVRDQQPDWAGTLPDLPAA